LAIEFIRSFHNFFLNDLLESAYKLPLRDGVVVVSLL